MKKIKQLDVNKDKANSPAGYIGLLWDKLSELINWQREMVALNPASMQATITGLLKIQEKVLKLEDRIAELEKTVRLLPHMKDWEVSDRLAKLEKKLNKDGFTYVVPSLQTLSIDMTGAPLNRYCHIKNDTDQKIKVTLTLLEEPLQSEPEDSYKFPHYMSDPEIQDHINGLGEKEEFYGKAEIERIAQLQEEFDELKCKSGEHQWIGVRGQPFDLCLKCGKNSPIDPEIPGPNDIVVDELDPGINEY